MAKSAQENSTQNLPPSAPPGEGWNNEVRPDIDGWVKPEDGVIIAGRIVGFFGYKQTVKDKSAPSGFVVRDREAVLIKVGYDTPAMKKGGEKLTLRKDQVIAASMMYCLEAIRPYVQDKGAVWIKFLRKESIGGGQTVWKAEVLCKGTKTAPVYAKPTKDAPIGGPGEDTAGPGSDDDIPF